MAKVVILIGGHLSTAPRAQKEAEAFSKLGHEVIVLGMWYEDFTVNWDRELIKKYKWQFAPIIDLRNKYNIKVFLSKLKRKLGNIIFNYLKIESTWQLGYASNLYYAQALKHKPNLVIAHSESTLNVALKLHKHGINIGVDFEDWFSEDLPDNARKTRPISLIKKLEKQILNKATYRVTNSNSLARNLESTYQSKNIVTVYNYFEPIDFNSTKNTLNKKIKLCWFSQTIGSGRGLELLLSALQIEKLSLELHIIGKISADYKVKLQNLAPDNLKNDLYFYEPIEPWNLTRFISQFDIGIVLEDPSIVNKDLVVSNKYFQYLSAGLAIIAYASKGQKEVWDENTPPGILIYRYDSNELRKVILDITASSDLLLTYKTKAQKYIELAYPKAKAGQNKYIEDLLKK